MKTRKLNTDQFAKFMANVIKSVKNYNYDGFYDIAKIVELRKANRGRTDEPIYDEFFLFSRDTGQDLVEVNDLNLNYRIINNTNQWHIKFCWNCDYFSNREYFAIITKIK
jgi:hypothetical protein